METDAAAHKKQWESLSPDDKIQILNKNADAHKKKWESLLPEDKDQFEKNNTAAQWWPNLDHWREILQEKTVQQLTWTWCESNQPVSMHQ